jgi:hypothetical protein
MAIAARRKKRRFSEADDLKMRSATIKKFQAAVQRFKGVIADLDALFKDSEFKKAVANMGTDGYNVERTLDIVYDTLSHLGDSEDLVEEAKAFDRALNDLETEFAEFQAASNRR